MKFKCVISSWKEINALTRKLVKKIKESDYKPEYIVSIARSGTVLGRMLAYQMSIKNFVSIKPTQWGVPMKRNTRSFITDTYKVDLKNKKILLVDDIADTGESFIRCIEFLKNMKEPLDIKTASLLNIKGTNFKTDFFAEERDWQWIIFPWNYDEDMANLIGKIINGEKMSAEEIKNELREKFDLEFKMEEIKEMLKKYNFV